MGSIDPAVRCVVTPNMCGQNTAIQMAIMTARKLLVDNSRMGVSSVSLTPQNNDYNSFFSPKPFCLTTENSSKVKRKENKKSHFSLIDVLQTIRLYQMCFFFKL